MTQSRLAPFAKPRLPLLAPVLYAGMRCRITGRAFGGVESYNLTTQLEGLQITFPDIGRGMFEVDFAALANNTECV